MTDLVAAEWIKLRSVRFGAVAGVVVLAAISLALLYSRYVAGLWDGLSASRRAHLTVAAPEQVLLLVMLIAVGVVGVLMITSEYRSGTIGISLTAVPGRVPVVLAKSVVVAGLATVVGEGFMFVTYLASRAVIGDRPINGLGDTSLGHDTPLLLVSGLLAPVMALVGLALGSLLRSAAGGIVAVVALLYVVPLLVVKLPAPWNLRIGSALPSSLPAELVGQGNTNFGALLPAWAAALVLAGYAVLPVAAAAWVLRRRDVG